MPARTPAGLILYMRYYIDLKRIGSAMRNPNYTDKEKVLLYIVTDHYQYCQNTGKVCRLSYSAIKKQTGWANDTIKKTIQSLVERGDITAETEQLGGRMKSTMEFTSGYVQTEEGYSNNWNSTIPETGTVGIPETGEINKAEKTTKRNSTIAESTYSSKCGVTENESSCSVAEDTSFLDGGNSEPKKSELQSTLDQLEWCIDNDVWPSDVSFELAFDKLSKNVEGLEMNYDYLRDRFDKRQTKKSLTRLSQCVSA